MSNSTDTSALKWRLEKHARISEYVPGASRAWLGRRGDLSTCGAVALVPIGAPAGSKMHYVVRNAATRVSIDIPKQLAGKPRACMRYLETIWRMSGE